jgi:hypothetical protein
VNKTRALFAAVLALVVVSWLSCRSNHAPAVPAVPAGPEYCLKDTTYTFKTVASDPDGDSVAIRFDWGDSTASHWVGWFASGDTVAFTHAWSDTGNFEIRVLAQDTRLLSSDSSEGLKVLVALRQPPNAPIEPSGPDSGFQDSSYEFQTSASHPDSMFVAIRFAWGDGDTSDWTTFWFQNAPVQMEHAWSAPGTFVVTAQAKDTGELTSQWSPPHTTIIRPTNWSRLRMVGAPILTSDSSGFLIRVINDGTVEDTVGWLAFSDASESLYMRDFRIDADRCGYPLPNGILGTGPGDTVHFTAPVTIAPDMSQMIELYLARFHVDPFGADTFTEVPGKTFQFRFSDGSLITVNP